MMAKGAWGCLPALRSFKVPEHRGSLPRGFSSLFVGEEWSSYRAMPPKVVAEYAKSGRASCKKCGKAIAKGSVRLGIVTKAAGGFDVTRWNHLNCFPSQIEDIVAADSINGFSLLKTSDQEALKSMVAEIGKTQRSAPTGVEGCGANEDPTEPTAEEKDGNESRSTKKLKVVQGESQDSHLVATEPIAEEKDGNESRSTKKLKVVQGESQLGDRVDDVDVLNGFSPSKLKNRYKDAILPPRWKAFETVIILGEEDGLQASEKIAAFDFDGCLVKTSVKRVGADAWSLMYSSIPEKLQSYYNKGYKLVIFTNESNIDRWKNSRQKAVDSKLGRLEGFIKRVEVPIQVFVACGIERAGDPFRKPKPGMWKLMEQHLNSSIVVDMEQSFYVGDAAGRTNDHSDADIRFAKAVGLKFFIPEDFFTEASA